MTDGVDNTWSADHLRVSLFSNDVWSVSAESIFSDVSGYSPETIVQTTAAHESSAVGSWEGLRLEVKRTLTRLDFVVQAVPMVMSVPFSLIKDVKSVLPRFSDLVSAWASAQPQGIVRVAVGCNALLQAQSVEACYEKLKELIKVIDVDAARFREFRFQVNLPATSSVCPEVTVNWLTHWASVMLRATLVGVDVPRYFDDQCYVSCLLDLNTDGDRVVPLGSDLVGEIAKELSRGCLKVLEQGIS